MKKLFTLLFAIVATSALWAEDFSVDGIYYKILADKTNEVEVTYRGDKYNSYSNEYSGSVTIPETVTYHGTTYSVTSIGRDAFYYCSGLTSITIPNSVTTIENHAFYGCKGLTSITIPNSVTKIGMMTFNYCTGLTSITIPNSVTSIGDRAFDGCSGLTSPVYNAHCFAYMPRSYKGAYIIPEGIKQIAGEAFFYCSDLTSINIPNSVTSIGWGAFYYCSGLTSVIIGNSVTSIEDDAFNRCYRLTSITIPNSVTSIGDGAFYGCSGLTSPVYNAHCFAYMPTSYTGAYAIPEGIKQIAGYAFNNCSSLTSITIPNSVTSIGERAFYGCSSLPVENNLRYADTYLVEAVDKTLSTYSIKEGTKWIGSNAFEGCSGLTSINIPNSVTSIGRDAFYYCSGLTSITIPNSVTSIRGWAFYGCYSLTSVTIGNSVTSIGDGAFSGCSGLTSVTIPNSVTSIGRSAFYGCSGLTFIESLAEIPPTLGTDAFYNVSTKIPLYVPCGTVSAYQSAEDWKAFTNIQEPLVEYSIAVDVNDSIMGTAKVEYNTYCEGNQISATANYGYHFVQWSDGNTDNPRALVLTQDTILTAEFAPNRYNITTTSSHAERGTTQGDTTVNYLEYTTISATANYGYHFTQWNDGNTDNPRVVQVTGDKTYTAYFDKNTYSITTQYDAQQGSITGPTSGKYLDVITLTATPKYGYHFTQWSDGNTDNPRTVQVIGDTTYIAQFDKNIYTITTYCDNQMGSVSAPDSAEYLDQVTITASAKVGYHFTQWSDGNTDNPRVLVLTQDTTFTAEFAVSYSGQCGDNLYWAYDEDSKKISITGSGNMYDYTKSTQPWYLFQEQITEVTTSNTTTSIGTSAFEGCIRLGKVSLGYGMEDIAANAFAECKRLYDIYVYATYPPFADESSFANYNVYLYIPCEKQRDYILDVVWGNFKFIECIGAESDETGGDDVTVNPGSNDVTITWPTEDEAETYSIVITKDGEVFCTLTFNNKGQLVSIAFAPGREGKHPAQYAEATANGYRFTVTGLKEGTKYGYNLDVKDSNNQTIQSYEGEFTTMSDVTTDMDNVTSTTNVQKLIRDGQLVIIRDGKTYNAQGVEL